MKVMIVEPIFVLGISNFDANQKPINKEENTRATVSYFVSTNSTVYVSGLRCALNQIFFAKSCFEVPKITIFSIF